MRISESNDAGRAHLDTFVAYRVRAKAALSKWYTKRYRSERYWLVPRLRYDTTVFISAAHRYQRVALVHLDLWAQKQTRKTRESVSNVKKNRKVRCLVPSSGVEKIETVRGEVIMKRYTTIYGTAGDRICRLQRKR